MLRFAELSLRRGARLLFEQADFDIHPGWRVGVCGANGCGKSSLFSLVRGRLEPDSGHFRRPADWRLAHLAQETPPDPRPAIEYVLDGDLTLRRLQAELEQATRVGDGHAVAEVHGRLEQAGAWEARARAARLLAGLGFADTDSERPVADFSGGWRMRLNLARALMCPSDLLLLDEPTNHLDLDAVLWLENWLGAYRGTLLLVSHDRDFLDAVSDHTLHIADGRVRLYSGNYSAFERARSEQLAAGEALRARQQREIAHMRAFVERFRAKASKARQAQSRLKALERMQVIAPAHVDTGFSFSFPAPVSMSSPLLSLERAAAGHGARVVLEGLDLDLLPGERIGLLGANGAGKSTLIKLLAGVLQPRAGIRRSAKDLVIGYFAQHQVEQLDTGHSALEQLRRLDADATEQSLRDFLGGFGFGGERAGLNVGMLSGGERARLALALLVYRRPNLLLLDEPTNHLDIDMRQALALALQDFAGALVLVSHDRHLLRLCCDRLLRVHDARVEDFDGSLDDYAHWLAHSRREAQGDGRPAREAVSRKDQKREAARQRQQLAPLRRALAEAETRLETAQEAHARLQRALAEPGLYEACARDRLKALLHERGELARALESAEADWLAAAEALEEAEAKKTAQNAN
ncbi:MAG TPA: ATP-binding cassette domain-containing protein [Gammaproteobacteria bacterium]|nr:ATP-binding cassette domain-containing protein [Gammaproteobacteria bacterium]